MSSSGEVRVGLNAPTLVLRDPDPALWRVPALATFLEDLDHCYRVAYELTHGVELFAIVNDSLLDIEYGRPRLLVADVRIGSLILQLVEEIAPYASAAGAGAALVAVARMLRGGTSGLDQWYAFMARSRTHRIRALREEAEERILLRGTRDRLTRLETAAPELHVEVLDASDVS